MRDGRGIGLVLELIDNDTIMKTWLGPSLHWPVPYRAVRDKALVSARAERMCDIN
jgi:hypothetical protein